MENWKRIPGFEHYEVSDQGRVRSLPHEVSVCGGGVRMTRATVLKPFKTGSGYLEVSLGRKGKRMIHRLVAETFLPRVEGKVHVNHKNLIKTDNRVSNLEWVTHAENMQHAHDNGAFPPEPHRKGIVCVETGLVFPSSYQAAEWVNEFVKQFSGSVTNIASNIRVAIRLQRRRYGYTWRHVEAQPPTTIPEGSTPKRVEMGGPS